MKLQAQIMIVIFTCKIILMSYAIQKMSKVTALQI